MPVATSAVPARPRLLMPLGVDSSAFRVSLRPGLGIVLGCLAWLSRLELGFGKHGVTVGAFELEVALDLTCLCRAQNVADCIQRARQVSGGGFQLHLHV
eukprot:1058791-Pleurochrysis_carterae.AAC.1